MPTDQAGLDQLRSHDHDRYLAAVLTPEPARAELFSLYAFAAEIARIPHIVREPLLGEIRLQWWRDAIGGGAAQTGNPVADRLLAMIGRHDLPVGLLLGMIDARSFDFTRDTMPDEQHLKSYLAKTDGALFNLAARVLGAIDGDHLERASAAAGAAVGMTRLLLALPADLAHHRIMIPRSLLDDGALLPGQQVALDEAIGQALPVLYERIGQEMRAAEPAIASLPRLPRLAFLPVCLVSSYLAVLRKPGRDPLHDLSELSPLRRLWRMWRASRTGRMA